MRPLRILHVTPCHTHAWAYGGIPRVTATMTAALSQRGHHVTVCTTDACAPDRRFQPPAGFSLRRPWRAPDPFGVDVHVFPNVSNRLAYHAQLYLPIGLAAHLRTNAEAFDVAHIHACHNVPGALAARHLRRAGVPYVVSPHGTALRVERRRTAKLLFDVTIGRALLPNAARVLAVTEAERRQLRSIGVPDGRITVIPNPMDLSEFDLPVTRGAFRRRHELGTGALVLFLGRISPRKGLDVLARAFAFLKPPGARLVIAGNDMGFIRELQRLVATLSIADRTIFTGLVAGRERLEALADADVVAYPSREEVFGLVPIEALLCGTPVVVADDSGCGEVIARIGGGRVVREGDAAALAEALGAMLASPQTWRDGTQPAGERIRASFSATAICDQLEVVYREVIGNRRG